MLGVSPFPPSPPASQESLFLAHRVLGNSSHAFKHPRLVEPNDIVQSTTILVIVDVVVDIGCGWQ